MLTIPVAVESMGGSLFAYVIHMNGEDRVITDPKNDLSADPAAAVWSLGRYDENGDLIGEVKDGLTFPEAVELAVLP